jgi:hypothetical protein
MIIPPFVTRHRGKIYPYLGDSAYGPRYGEPIEVKYRMDFKRRLITRSNGSQVVANATAILSSIDGAMGNINVPYASKFEDRHGHEYHIEQIMSIETLIPKVSHIEVFLI